jgi:integrase
VLEWVAMAKTLINVLTDVQLRHWIKQKTPVIRADGQNLWFTLSKAGTASWVLRYRKDGKRPELTIGNYPDISLTEARKLAGQYRASIDQGSDPAKEKATKKEKARTEEWTVALLAEDYRAKQLTEAQFAKGTRYYRSLDLKNAIIPKLGKRTVTSVTGQDIVQMIQDNGDTWTISKRVLTTATKLFDHAAGLRIVHINPCIGIRLTSLLGPRPPIKERVMLHEVDLRTLLATIDTLGTENSLALRLLLATCVRGSELVQAKWADVDLDKLTWYVPKGNTKMRKGFYVPIAPSAAEWFKELRALAGDSPFVLPARNSLRAGTHIDPRTLWAAITRAFDTGRFSITKFTPHDVRSTAKGHMMNMGIPDYVSELALNHVVKGMQAIYDVRKEIPEKRHAMNVWADYLASLMPSSAATGSN